MTLQKKYQELRTSAQRLIDAQELRTSAQRLIDAAGEVENFDKAGYEEKYWRPVQDDLKEAIRDLRACLASLAKVSAKNEKEDLRVKHSKKAQAIVENIQVLNRDLFLSEFCSDSQCTPGYDNDGSTGFDIFENGVDLGRLAGDKKIFFVKTEGQVYFFIGNEDEVVAKINEAAKNFANNEN